MSQSGPVSRPSKTNPADPQNGGHGPSRAEALDQPLADRAGVALRAELEEFYRGGDEARRAVSWREAVHRWRDYIRDSRDTAPIFQNVEDGRRIEGGDPHRFDPEYCDKQYAKLKDLERGIRADYGKRLHTAMLTLTGSSTDAAGGAMSPVDHLDDVLSSWSAVTRALRRCMEGRRYERLAILEPHESGYLHIHIAVFVDGVVTRGDFAPVIEAHLRNCSAAGEEAHDLDDDSTISVRHVGGDRDDGAIENLGTYLAEYLGTYGDDPLDSDEHVQMSNAILWATGRRRWRPSNGAQEYMATRRGGDDDAESPWRLVAIRDGDEEHEVEDPSGGVRRFTTGPRADTDPPPDDLPDWCRPY